MATATFREQFISHGVFRSGSLDDRPAFKSIAVSQNICEYLGVYKGGRSLLVRVSGLDDTNFRDKSVLFERRYQPAT